MLAEMHPANPHLLLDLGCGDGRLTELVLACRPSILKAMAFDRSPPMLTLARKRFAANPPDREQRRAEQSEGAPTALVVEDWPDFLHLAPAFVAAHTPEVAEAGMAASFLEPPGRSTGVSP